MQEHTEIHAPAARWTLVAGLVAFAALGHFNRIAISVAGNEVFIPKLQLSETRMGWVYTAFLICYTVGMLPGGWLIDRIGSARALAWYGTTMGLFVMLTGGLGAIVSGATAIWTGMLLIRGLAGFCSAPLHPGAAHVVSEVMPSRSRPTANGLVTAGALLGIAFCYPLFGSLIDRLNWPLAFVVSGALLILFSQFWLLFAVPYFRDRDAQVVPVSESTTQEPSSAGWTMLTRRDLWLLSMSYAAYGYFQYLFFYWAEHYFEETIGLPKVEARWATFWVMLAQGGGMIFGGLLTDTICRRFGAAWGRRMIVFSGMGAAGVLAVIAVKVTGEANVLMCLALSMACLGTCEGVFWTTATDIGGRSRGFSGAFMNTLGNAGGFVSPVLTPMMAQSLGWPGAITVACLIAVAGGAIWFLIPLRDAETPKLRDPVPPPRE